MVFTVDHHRGSEENQAGWEWHDPTLVDPEFDLIDTLPFFRKTVARRARGGRPASWGVRPPWRDTGAHRLALFIDGGHTGEHVTNDFGRVSPGGSSMASWSSDVFERPQDGGQPPWRVYRRAIVGGWGTGHPSRLDARPAPGPR